MTLALTTAAVVAAVVLWLLATLPPSPARPRGGRSVHSAPNRRRRVSRPHHGVRRRGRPGGHCRRRGARGLQFVIVTDHGDGTAIARPRLPRRRAVHRAARDQHERRPLRRARHGTGAVPARRGSGRRGRGRRAARRVRRRGAPGFAETRARVDGLDGALRRHRVAERRYRVAQRVARAPRARAVRLPGPSGARARVRARSSGATLGALGRPDLAAPA